MKNILHHIYTTILFIFSVHFAFSQPKLTADITSDPTEIKFIYKDIQQFVTMYKNLPAGQDTTDWIKTNYLDIGTPGLKRFMGQYDLTETSLAKAISEKPGLYDSTQYLEKFITDNKKQFTHFFQKYKEIYPDVVYPPFYFLVGANRGINSGSPEGVLAEVEIWHEGREDTYTALLVHELTHFNQAKNVGLPAYIQIYTTNQSVLNFTIREGIAEFMTRLVTGRYTQEKTREYVIEHEKELWEEFQQIKSNKETGDWMFNFPKDNYRPFDIGYVFGAMIVQYYYDNATDKKQALKDILNEKDYEAFIEKSGYAQKFKGE